MLLPCWRKIFMDTGERPVVLVSREFSGLFKGTSYIEPDVVNAHWYGGLSSVMKMAKVKYGDFTITQCHGIGHSTDHSKYATFGEAMWEKAGFPGQYGTMPTIFDRRNPEREKSLVDRWTNGKPFILYNFLGRSSPLTTYQNVQLRLRRFQKDFDLVNLGAIQAVRFYDLLGLYDLAAGLVSIDTATLHLANASKVPLLAYCRGGWSTAIPKPGATRVWYSEAERLEVIDQFVQSLRPKPANVYA